MFRAWGSGLVKHHVRLVYRQILPFIRARTHAPRTHAPILIRAWTQTHTFTHTANTQKEREALGR